MLLLSSASFYVQHLIGTIGGCGADAMPTPNSGVTYEELIVAPPASDASPLISQDHLLNLLLNDNGDSIEGEGPPLPMVCHLLYNPLEIRIHASCIEVSPIVSWRR